MQAGGACSATAWFCPTANEERLLPGGDSRWGHTPKWQGAEDGTIKFDGSGAFNLSTSQRCHAGSSLATGSKKNTVQGRSISCLPHKQLRQVLLLSTLGQSWLLKFSPPQCSDLRPWVGAVLHLQRVQHHKSVQLHISAPWCQTGVMRAPESKCHHSKCHCPRSMWVSWWEGRIRPNVSGLRQWFNQTAPSTSDKCLFMLRGV